MLETGYLDYSTLVTSVACLLKQHEAINLRAVSITALTPPDNLDSMGTVFRADVTAVCHNRHCIAVCLPHDAFANIQTRAKLDAFLGVARQSSGLLIVATNRADQNDAEALICQIGASKSESALWLFPQSFPLLES